MQNRIKSMEISSNQFRLSVNHIKVDCLTPLHALIGPDINANICLLNCFVATAEALKERVNFPGIVHGSVTVGLSDGSELSIDPIRKIVIGNPVAATTASDFNSCLPWMYRENRPSHVGSQIIDELSMAYENTFLAISCPEHGLYPTKMGQLVKALRVIAGNGQVLIHTDSPLVINELEPREVTLITRDSAPGVFKSTRMDKTKNFDTRFKIYALGELWLSYSDGYDETDLIKG